MNFSELFLLEEMDHFHRIVFHSDSGRSLIGDLLALEIALECKKESVEILMQKKRFKEWIILVLERFDVLLKREDVTLRIRRLVGI